MKEKQSYKGDGGDAKLRGEWSCLRDIVKSVLVIVIIILTGVSIYCFVSLHTVEKDIKE